MAVAIFGLYLLSFEEELCIFMTVDIGKYPNYKALKISGIVLFIALKVIPPLKYNA